MNVRECEKLEVLFEVIYILLLTYFIKPREHEGTERDTEGVGCDMSYKVIFSFRKSVSRDVRTEYNLDLRFLVKFNDNGGFVVGTHKHFSWEYKKSLFFMVYKR